MLFSSLIFVFAFLPVTILLYYLMPKKGRNYVLLAASLFFYAYGEPRFIFIMIASILVNYLCALGVSVNTSRAVRRLFLFIALLTDLGILFLYKYAGFFGHILESLLQTSFDMQYPALPIGISFYTFQILSYFLDVYNGRAEVQHNPFKLILYISFFPQLIAGPIVRYTEIEKQLSSRRETLTGFGIGAEWFCIGFAKKVIIANHCAVIAEAAFARGTGASLLLYWLGAIAYAIQIYYDFSGYSDMAIGLGRMFGFTFSENFNDPYCASSITDFWRRWHISLSSWFRDYVYIPLGGSRQGEAATVRNLFTVWFLTGLWHGANYTFIVWGLAYFFLLIIEKYVIREGVKNPVYRVFTLLAVLLLWVIFNSPSLSSAMTYILGMFGHGITGLSDPSCLYLLREYGVYLLAGILLCIPCIRSLPQSIEDKIHVLYTMGLFAKPVLTVLILLWAVSFIAAGSHNPFIYFNF